jgi:hypothetical protein
VTAPVADRPLAPAEPIVLAPPGLSCALCWSAAEVVDAATGTLLCIPCANDRPSR